VGARRLDAQEDLVSEPIDVQHALSAEEALERLHELARRHDVELTPGADTSSGTLVKAVGFFGSVQGRYRIEATRVEIVIESAPAVVGESTLRRLLSDALEEAFGA